MIDPEYEATIDDLDKELEKSRIQLLEAKMVSSGLVVIIDSSVTSGQCPLCDQSKSTIQTRRLNTAYADDAQNWLTSCMDCYEETVEHYRDLWAEYYAGQGVY